ncbi:uncharacterized protein MONBRDRAFT_21989 [Monosiga brevicollis MX1]|uniref:Uncharacterized protein n=1 Tax=Monosiga brevicollis TaxID=81824 RepID=A9UP76_MONBE|nr:uncharacterized protein MONBRDRAFT_21989 [Monosiga brevicollis MX1]EDQ92824.1 predicted protein [Monosiga brevicollis MX1]|eukprot:XP_001742586.1 hypothetical protein [Monosiga brevicollis MX1]
MISAFFSSFREFAIELERDSCTLRQRAQAPPDDAKHYTDAKAMLVEMQEDIENVHHALHELQQEPCYDYTMADLVALCSQIHEATASRLGAVEDELEQYGYVRPAECDLVEDTSSERAHEAPAADESGLNSTFTHDDDEAGESALPTPASPVAPRTPSGAGTSTGALCSAPITPARRFMAAEKPAVASPRTPCLEDMGLSSVTLDVLKHHGTGTSLLRPAFDAEVRVSLPLLFRPGELLPGWPIDAKFQSEEVRELGASLPRGVSFGGKHLEPVAEPMVREPRPAASTTVSHSNGMNISVAEYQTLAPSTRDCIDLDTLNTQLRKLYLIYQTALADMEEPFFTIKSLG